MLIVIYYLALVFNNIYLEWFQCAGGNTTSTATFPIGLQQVYLINANAYNTATLSSSTCSFNYANEVACFVKSFDNSSVNFSGMWTSGGERWVMVIGY